MQADNSQQTFIKVLESCQASKTKAESLFPLLFQSDAGLELAQRFQSAVATLRRDLDKLKTTGPSGAQRCQAMEAEAEHTWAMEKALKLVLDGEWPLPEGTSMPHGFEKTAEALAQMMSNFKMVEALMGKLQIICPERLAKAREYIADHGLVSEAEVLRNWDDFEQVVGLRKAEADRGREYQKKAEARAALERAVKYYCCHYYYYYCCYDYY